MGTADERQAELYNELLRQHEGHPQPGLSGEKLRLHVALHAVVETQISEGHPPQTAAALERLLGEGLDRHQAIHALGQVVAEEIFDIMKEERSYDEARFVTRMEALSAETFDRVTEESGDGAS